ncbi:hypothetical protein FIBSPDRAFT_925338 [Athelia psychrophila]|uniref:F-box domain-containing protein n=1 Tax=Athelia psychrophila TaxID=1759441 RepID=A0A166V7N2_9AGAM|nr:hypothetical protein FIBSPDRAFT_925338 [Fibularhizoctonia sp. CBS 109695]
MALKSLTRLELQLIDFGQPPSALPITLPSLQILEVDFDRRSSYTKHIVLSIHAVSLISLSLSGWYYGDDDGDEPWSSQESLAPSLRHLFVSGYFSKGLSEFDWFSRTFPNIDRLTCWGEDVDMILAAIAVGGGDGNEGGLGDGPRWPKLQSIGATESFWPEPCDCAVLRGAILKLQNGRPFRTLALPERCVAHLDANAMAELREIISIGDFYGDWPMPFNFQGLRRPAHIASSGVSQQ